MTDVGQLACRRRRRGGRGVGDFDGEAGRLAHLLRRDAGVQAGGSSAAGREIEDAQRGDQGRRTAAAPAGEVTGRGDVIDALAKAAWLVLHDQYRPAGERRDVTRAATTRK